MEGVAEEHENRGHHDGGQAPTNRPEKTSLRRISLASAPRQSVFRGNGAAKVALRGVVAGGAGYAAYSFLKPVDADHDFTGAAKKKPVGRSGPGPRPKLKREASSSRII